MIEVLFNILLFYVVFACWFHGWIVGVDKDLRPQPSFWLQIGVALCWPLVLWYGFMKGRSL